MIFLKNIRVIFAWNIQSMKKTINQLTKQTSSFSFGVYLLKFVTSISCRVNSLLMFSLQRRTLILGSLFLLTGCGLESLPISVEPAEPQIAVSSLIGPSETMFVTLSRSFSALSAEDANDLSQDVIDRLLLDHALVVIEYEGYSDTLETFFDIKGLFGTQLQAFEDFQLMKLTVFDSTTSETIASEALLLPQVEVDSIQVTRRDTSINFLADFSYKILDPDGDNFYVIQAYQLTDPDTTQSDSTGNEVFFSDQGFLIYEQLLTDRGAEEGVIRKDDVFEFTSSTDSALVIITNISEGYYNFLEARKRSGGIISSLANEPVNHPTNIEGGVGYFSAHRPKAIIVEVEEN